MYFCKECGSETNKWSGKCPVCGAWNSLQESKFVTGKKKMKTSQKTGEPAQINQIAITEKERFKCGISEFDGVLGGGLISGMVILIGGEPGIGKSTLLLQISEEFAKKDKVVFYFSGEESLEQISLRAKRLKCSNSNLFIISTNSVDEIINLIEKHSPDLAIIDSIQSVAVSYLDSAPGNISQIRETTGNITKIAKQLKIPVILVGHVTKDGYVSGPKIIEHMVDTVLYFEGEVRNQFKILRTTKNRFGSTNEIGIFEMRSNGLIEVKNPSKMFIGDVDSTSGSAIGSISEGSRIFLVEVQALVSNANYGNSQRVALGIDQKKLAMLLAVMEKKLSIKLRNNDVFINLAGGIKSFDPALDLAITASIFSGFSERVIPNGTLFIGEIGLNGEIRIASQIDKRINEAIKLGYSQVVLSARSKQISDKIKLIKIKKIGDLLGLIT